jgi:Protein of unknown function (DUF3043)
VRLLRSKSAEPGDEATTEAELAAEEVTVVKGYTPGKGRATPKRREAEQRRRGPVAPPPRTQREAMKRNKTSKEDRRSAAAERRARMASGDERYLMPRDKGPVKAYVRDLVDSRRHVVGLFMPLALVVLVVMLAPLAALQAYAPYVTLGVLIIMVIDGLVLARYAIRKVRLKFPEANERGMALGWYAFVRASQIRKLRLPKPRVQPGEDPV